MGENEQANQTETGKAILLNMTCKLLAIDLHY